MSRGLESELGRWVPHLQQQHVVPPAVAQELVGAVHVPPAGAPPARAGKGRAPGLDYRAAR